LAESGPANIYDIKLAMAVAGLASDGGGGSPA
jgi:hypothetical protein